MALPLLRSLTPMAIATVRSPICKPYYLSTGTILTQGSRRSDVNKGGDQKTHGNKGGEGTRSNSDQNSAKNNIEGVVVDDVPKKTPGPKKS